MAANRKIAILGAGRIGESLLAGLLSSGWREPSEVVVTARHEEWLAELRERHGAEATADNAAAVSGPGVVVVAVKPQDIDFLLGEIGQHLTPEQTVVSVAAAIPTAHIEERIADGVPVVRAMPNAPATVHEGMAGICAGAHAGDEQLALAEELVDVLRLDRDDDEAGAGHRSSVVGGRFGAVPLPQFGDPLLAAVGDHDLAGIAPTGAEQPGEEGLTNPSAAEDRDLALAHG